MKNTQSGFTLIELVVVIVLLGILGVTALGKFENLSSDAADAAVKGIAGELSSAAAINYAARTINPANGVEITTADCAGQDGVASDTLNNLMASGSAPGGTITYAFITSGGTFGGSEGDSCDAGKSFSCSVTDSKGTAFGTASILCTSS
jgi:prepilin-type N-terminal cleavage/methylation domain-containing protein